jgi:hypothetical protein
MINFNGNTIKDVHIKPDRFGMAAISTIYKAFGDNVRSKEMWPWSERVGNDWQWEKSKGTINDLRDAVDLIEYAVLRYELEMDAENQTHDIEDTYAFVKSLKRRINRVKNSINTAENITDAVNKTSIETLEEKESIDPR